MNSFIKFVVITTLFCCAIGTVRSQYDTDPFLNAHKDHNHGDTGTLLYMSIAAKHCRVSFNVLHQKDWKEKIEGCAAAQEYNNTEEVPPIYDTSDYSRYFNHSDNCFHYCVLYYLGVMDSDFAPVYISEDNQIVVDDILINHHGFRTDVDYFTYGRSHVANFRQNWDKNNYNIAYAVMEKCDKAAGRAIAEVYGYIDPKFDKSELLDKTKPPFDDPQCAYGSLFAFCLQNEFGNNFQYNYEAYYYYCLDRIAHRYMFLFLCFKYVKEKDNSECYPEAENVFVHNEYQAKYG